MVKELMQAFVVLLLAIPFIYMAYDVTRELSRNVYKLIAEFLNYLPLE